MADQGQESKRTPHARCIDQPHGEGGMSPSRYSGGEFASPPARSGSSKPMFHVLRLAMKAQVTRATEPHYFQGFGIVRMVHLGLVGAARLTRLLFQNAPAEVDASIASAVVLFLLLWSHPVFPTPSPHIFGVARLARFLTSAPGIVAINTTHPWHNSSTTTKSQ